MSPAALPVLVQSRGSSSPCPPSSASRQSKAGCDARLCRPLRWGLGLEEAESGLAFSFWSCFCTFLLILKMQTVFSAQPREAAQGEEPTLGAGCRRRAAKALPVKGAHSIRSPGEMSQTNYTAPGVASFFFLIIISSPPTVTKPHTLKRRSSQSPGPRAVLLFRAGVVFTI